MARDLWSRFLIYEFQFVQKQHLLTTNQLKYQNSSGRGWPGAVLCFDLMFVAMRNHLGAVW
jgi:hypothetical protein